MTDSTAKPLTLKQANKAQAKRIADHLAKQATAAGKQLPTGLIHVSTVETVGDERWLVTISRVDHQ